MPKFNDIKQEADAVAKAKVDEEALAAEIAAEEKAKQEADEKAASEKQEMKTPDLTGLVKMSKEGKVIYANPAIVDHHKSNGWKLA